MIPRPTVEKIIEAAHVEEVVGEFVTLKKRGTNLLGLCPFHGEKTPSFTVSAVKGIYKCFGCGKAGNAVNFVMDHLRLTYPEALKWLAKKYGIEVVEKELTPEEREQQTERESMIIVMQYAQRYFTEQMMESDEGRSIGLGYFKERGLRDEIITRFQLGYSPEARNAFGTAAVKAGYRPKYLVKTGMSIVSNRHAEGTEITANDIFDRYAGRVMFPIHDDGGRVVAFGGRTLSSDKKTAKYINSPETEIYNKSRILYGLWLGKKSIQDKNSCYLVEGYMDVIAMHQAGIENVVASSGTSLTIEQIKSIHRFTKNIVVLYDGDLAGQKASNRAIPLLLEEGMNVRLLQFPDNDDPDSFARKVGREEFHGYLENNTTDFLEYKSRKLKETAKNDPIRRAEVLRDIVENIAVIPDGIIRSVYIKTCASNMEMEELVLQQEVNKIRRRKGERGKPEITPPEEKEISLQVPVEAMQSRWNCDTEERALLRIMLLHGRILTTVEATDNDGQTVNLEMSLSEYILFDLHRDGLAMENVIHNTVLDAYANELAEGRFATADQFINSSDPLINSFVINHVLPNYELNKWNKVGVTVPAEILNLRRDVDHILYSLKEKKVAALIASIKEKLQSADWFDQETHLRRVMELESLKMKVNKLLGRIVVS